MTEVWGWLSHEVYMKLDRPNAWTISCVRTSRIPPTAGLCIVIEEGLKEDGREEAAEVMAETAPGHRLTTAIIGRPKEAVSRE